MRAALRKIDSNFESDLVNGLLATGNIQKSKIGDPKQLPKNRQQKTEIIPIKVLSEKNFVSADLAKLQAEARKKIAENTELGDFLALSYEDLEPGWYDEFIKPAFAEIRTQLELTIFVALYGDDPEAFNEWLDIPTNLIKFINMPLAEINRFPECFQERYLKQKAHLLRDDILKKSGRVSDFYMVLHSLESFSSNEIVDLTQYFGARKNRTAQNKLIFLDSDFLKRNPQLTNLINLNEQGKAVLVGIAPRIDEKILAKRLEFDFQESIQTTDLLQRRFEKIISTTPLLVEYFGQDDLGERGIKTFDDLLKDITQGKFFEQHYNNRRQWEKAYSSKFDTAWRAGNISFARFKDLVIMEFQYFLRTVVQEKLIQGTGARLESFIISLFDKKYKQETITTQKKCLKEVNENLQSLAKIMPAVRKIKIDNINLRPATIAHDLVGEEVAGERIKVDFYIDITLCDLMTAKARKETLAVQLTTATPGSQSYESHKRPFEKIKNPQVTVNGQSVPAVFLPLDPAVRSAFDRLFYRLPSVLIENNFISCLQNIKNNVQSARDLEQLTSTLALKISNFIAQKFI